MYKRIMVAVDGSKTAQNALEEAQNIANSYNAGLSIVHVITEDTDAGRQAGNHVLDQARNSVDGLSIETHLLLADLTYGLNGISEVISAAVKEESVDLLVVGTANRRGLERFVVGSVAEQLVSKVESSILLVRPES
ncbi:universal stress protein [uncultured Nitrosomonas sp.]|uniref:universal stress protein n=1 Tax=uncultured Nitrosomonas sp. TaxID=156424 RepID=UPI0025E8196A|nr:universal stress protein [uncultured Nitrosomonas sp.]